MRLRPGLSALTVVVFGIALATPVPYVVVTPGPTFNTIGQMDGKDLVHIDGAPTYPTRGSLRMVTVREYGGPTDGVSLWQAIAAWFSQSEKVIPREAIFPEGVSREETSQMGAEQFSTSQSDAIAAALGYLELPVIEKVVISDIRGDAPAHDRLHAGDQVTSLDGVAMSTPEQVVAAVRKQPVGTELSFTVIRDGKEITVSVTSAARTDDPDTELDETGLPYIGAGLDTLYEAPFDISFEVEGVGGPSAGTMFALAIVDKLTPDSLTQGKDIAGTGTISPDGQVGAIGGIAQKMAGARSAGATLFLAPETNCDEVMGHIPAGLTVTPVSTLAQAISAITNYLAGKSLPECTATQGE